MSGMTEETPTFHCNSSNLKAAEEVASCLYEFDTCWGTEVSMMTLILCLKPPKYFFSFGIIL